MYMNQMRPLSPFNQDNPELPLPIDFNKVQDGTQKFEIRPLYPNVEGGEQEPIGAPNNNKSLESNQEIKKLGVKDNSNDQGIFSKSPFHYHDGIDQPFINLQFIAGFVQELDVSPPTHKPRNFYEQIVYIDNAGTNELWFYIAKKDLWVKIY